MALKPDLAEQTSRIHLLEAKIRTTYEKAVASSDLVREPLASSSSAGPSRADVEPLSCRVTTAKKAAAVVG